MEKLNINSNTKQLENFDSSESTNIDPIKLAMEKVKQSICKKAKTNPEILFILKRL